MIPNIVQAAVNLTQKGAWCSAEGVGNIVSDLIWRDENIQRPTDEALQAEMERLQAEYDNAQYARDRQYPSVGDQLDALFHAGVFPAEMAAEIQAVKDKYPKA
jgi:hypothetical protein